MQNLPKVSIILPCRNEELYIKDCLESVINFDYPHQQLELFLVDGLSTDNTLGIALQYVEQNSFIKILKNEKKIFPAAINIGYNNSSGDVIVILGAHAKYEINYISKCVEYLFKLDADNVGGVLTTVGLNNSMIGKAITNVLSSSFGVGNSTFRTGSEKVTEVDTVFGGCYKRGVFERIGNFNENLVSTSDMDFNTRLRKSGGKIYLVPEIIVTYYTRTTFSKFMKNNFRNGFWAIYPIRFVENIPVSLRHFIPLMFLTGIMGAIFLSFFSIFFMWILLFVLALYLLIAISFSLRYIKEGVVSFLILPLLYFSLHFVYGLGSLYGLLKVIFSKKLYPHLSEK
jgi:glycosyltransferase involved in cell wall biosynthesis